MLKTWAPLHKTMVTLQLMISMQSIVTIIDFLTSIGYGAMVVTIDCRDTINFKVTIVLCNRADLLFCKIQHRVCITFL